MRPLVLAAALAALAGCSMPYDGTSFAALPKPEHMAEGEHHETEKHSAEGEAHSSQSGLATSIYNPDADAVSDLSEAEDQSRTGMVFPKTAQPSTKRLLVQEGYQQDGVPSAHSSEGGHE